MLLTTENEPRDVVIVVVIDAGGCLRGEVLCESVTAKSKAFGRRNFGELNVAWELVEVMSFCKSPVE